MSVINTNITALIGQQNLGKSQGTLQTAMERLSSGLRINSAADDAAGQAIANRMTSQIDGLAQAQRNANDGISVAQTSEGALNQINENLQRIRELTVQAENGTNSSDDLASIQDEINLRLDEVDRIAEETSFNGVKVLADGESLTIQVGANDGETIQINLDSTNAEQLGLSGFSVTGPEGTTAAASNTQVEDVTGFDNVTDHTVTAFTAGDLDLSGGVTGSGTTFADENGDLYAKVTVDGTALNSTDVEKLEAEGLDVDTSSATNEFYVALDSDDATLSGGTATFDATGSTELSDLTAARTANPLDKVDDALKAVDSQRSELGAIQNRFESAITNLSTTETNLSAARSRIEDADYAVEVSNLTRAQILQQAGTSVLAQANQVPQTALSLLG